MRSTLDHIANLRRQRVSAPIWKSARKQVTDASCPALLQIGQGDPAITALACVAILLASINVFGGFAVTRRMLAMFSRS